MTRFRRRSAIRSSRQKGLSSFTDNFSLTSGMKPAWKSSRGLWSSAGSNAISTNSASEYPISTITMSRTSPVTISTGVSGGTGLAFWVTDADNWFATVSYNTSSTFDVCDQGFVENTNNPPSGNCCSSTNSRVVQSSVCDQTFIENESNPPSANCCSGISYTPPVASYSYNYSYTARFNQSYSYSASASTTFNPGYSYTASSSTTFNPGYSYTASSSTTFSPGYSYTATASTTFSAGGYCCSASSYSKTFAERTGGYDCCSDPGRFGSPNACSNSYGTCYFCYGNTTFGGSTASCRYPSSTTTTYSCPNGGSLSGTTCTVSGTTTTTYSCPLGGTRSGTTCTVSGTTTTTYSCPNGGTRSGTTCTVASSTSTTYSCPNGGSLSGTTCTVASSYSCPNGGSLSGTTCTVTVNVPLVPAKYGCFTGTRVVNTTYYSCYTSNRSVTAYNYYLRVIRSNGGAVSSVGNDLALTSQAAAIKIQISGSGVTSIAYSNASMTTSLGSRTDNFISAAQTKLFGIIKSPSPYNQGLTVTNFNATI